MIDINRRQAALGLLVLPLAALMAPPAAFADPLADAKAAGQVGERPDGYLGVVPAKVSPAILAMVERINSERKVRYQAIAAKNKTSLAAVEVVAGTALVRDAPGGTYVMNSSGQWQKK